jgi:hypothetical protein
MKGEVNMRLVRNLRRLIRALHSRWADVRDQCAEAYRAMRARFWLRWTSDRVRHRLDQMSVQVAASTIAGILVWMLTRGH